MSQTNTLVKAQKITSFKRSLAVVIGINEYQNKIPKLQTARRDAEVLAQILSEEHQYDEVILITDETECKPTLKNLLTLLEERLPKEIQLTKDDRLLFYFAGHGIARDSDKGPAGCLVPQDADLEKNENLLPMQKLHDCLSALSCRHLLVILDCCFAGTFRWSTARLATVIPTVIRKEHYDRFIKSPAWQAITSAAHNQEALDTIRLRDNRGGINHSPFAEALFKALRGEGDVIPAAKNGKSAGDGVITATELYLYLRDHVETASNESQTPGIWTLSRHDRGEYIFLVPGADPKLKPAPKLNEKNNPYRGLQSFEEEHSQLFFGRKELVEELYKKVSHASTLTVVLGVSGSGKSSLVKAGLIPYLRQNHSREWYILKPMRPSESPFTALARTLLLITNNNEIVVSKQLDNLHFIDEIIQQKITDLNQKIDDGDRNSESDEITRLEQKVNKYKIIADIWKRGTKQAKQLLIVDNFDEINNLCRVPNEQRLLKEAVLNCLNPLSQRLQDPNEFIKIVKTWSEQRPGIRLLLVIDQFEELITLSSQSKEDKQNKQSNLTESQQFLKLLEETLKANLPQLSIVVTLRSDFEPRFLNSGVLKLYWAHARFPVRAMRSDELRQAIERPAAEMALYFEQLPGERNPVDKLVDEVGQMPGALPLLSFTLSELYIKLAKKWETGESSDRALTLDAEFDFEGGVAGSLTQRANKEYDSLPDDPHRDTMRRVMLRMVTVENGVSARRRVSLSELVYADKHDPSKPDDKENQRVELILKRLIDARLVVSGQETGEPYVEPAHDFLVKSWDKLQKWQQQEQEDLLLQRRLTPNALEWKNKEQPASVLGKAEPVLSWFDKKIDSTEDWFSKIRKGAQEPQREKKGQFLWNGNPYLDVLRKKLKSVDYWFNQVEAEFVQQSVWQRRRNLNLRWSIAIGVTVVSVSLTFWALASQRDAEIEQIRTSIQASEALFLSNQQLNALISGSRARKNFSNPLLQIFPPNPQLREQVLQSLRKVVYGMKERNRWEPMPKMEVRSIFFHPNGKLLIATKSNNGTFQLWDMKIKGQPVLQLPGHNFQRSVSTNNVFFSPDNVFFSPDGSKIATVDSQGIVRLWDWNGNKLKEFKAGYEIEKLSFSPNGQTLATKGYDNKDDKKLLKQTVRWWNLEGRSITPAKSQQAIDFAFKSDGSLISAYEKSFSIILSGLSSKPISVPPGAFELSQISLSPNGNYIVLTRAYGNSFSNQMWKRNGSKLEEALSLGVDAYIDNAQITSFSSDSKLVAFANNNTVRIYNLSTFPGSDFRPFNEIKLPSGTIENMVFSQNGKYIATQSENGTVRLWNVYIPQPDESKQYQFLQNDIQNISFSPDSKTLATVDNNGTTIRLFDSSGRQLSEFSVTSSKVTSISFSPNSKTIATGHKNGTISFFNHNGKESEPIKAYLKNVESIVFSPDGQRFGTLGYDSKVADGSDIYVAKLWKLHGEKLELEEQLEEYPYSEKVHSVRFNANEDFRVVTEVNSQERAATVSLWKMTGEPQVILPGELKPTSSNSIAVSPDGSLLASVSTVSKNIIKLWDLQNRNLLMEFKYNECNPQADQCITSISFSPDGSTLAVIGSDGSAKFWHLGSFDDLLAKGCDGMHDYLATLNENNSDRHLCDSISNSQR